MQGILHTVWQHVQYVGSVVLPLERYSELLNVRYQREMSGVYHREAVSCIIKIASVCTPRYSIIDFVYWYDDISVDTR